eukprot:2971000-Prymnesium_polylepis.2
MPFARDRAASHVSMSAMQPALALPSSKGKLRCSHGTSAHRDREDCGSRGSVGSSLRTVPMMNWRTQLVPNGHSPESRDVTAPPVFRWKQRQQERQLSGSHQHGDGRPCCNQCDPKN